MLNLLLVEDNKNLRAALKAGLEETGAVRPVHHCGSGEEALDYCLKQPPDVILMDVQLAGAMNGIEAAIAIRREFPRLPVVFYSIQDDDAYYHDFRRSGILSHYAYVRKSNYLLPSRLADYGGVVVQHHYFAVVGFYRTAQCRAPHLGYMAGRRGPANGWHFFCEPLCNFGVRANTVQIRIMSF